MLVVTYVQKRIHIGIKFNKQLFIIIIRGSYSKITIKSYKETITAGTI